MPKILTGILPRSFEVIRDRIGEILAEELPSQATLLTEPDLDVKVWVERFVPFDKEELPAINVLFNRGDYGNTNIRSQHADFNFEIHLHSKAKSSATDRGDVLSMEKLQRLIGVCQAILMDSSYIRLAFDPPTVAPLISGREVKSIETFSGTDNKDAESVAMGRIILSVLATDTVEFKPSTVLGGYETSVKLGLTDKGYVFSKL